MTGSNPPGIGSGAQALGLTVLPPPAHALLHALRALEEHGRAERGAGKSQHQLVGVLLSVALKYWLTLPPGSEQPSDVSLRELLGCLGAGDQRRVAGRLLRPAVDLLRHSAIEGRATELTELAARLLEVADREAMDTPLPADELHSRCVGLADSLLALTSPGGGSR
ncbi:hypothetical protein [Streptomyces rhizosphaericus]|uniref:hypothetical protein n=1 Tax=Streptomyces rhizosphaericus TaxID=114699 RepID=UPI00117F3D4E|nr:hypothetical protein [Streptomyces rhizosphaericus]